MRWRFTKSKIQAMAECSYCKGDFDKEDLIEHHKSYRPEKTIKVCKSCHFTLHIDKITDEKSREYESIQMELDELCLRIKKLSYKIENKVSHPAPKILPLQGEFYERTAREISAGHKPRRGCRRKWISLK